MSEMTVGEIERTLDRDRADLVQSLGALRERLSLHSLLADGKQAAMAQVAPIAAGVDKAIRSHPLAAGVAGVALATLVLGQGRRAPESGAAVPALAGTRFEALSRWEDEGGPPSPEPVEPEETWFDEARGLRVAARKLLRRIDDASRRGIAPAAQLAGHRAEVLAALGRDTATVLGRGLDSLTGAARDQVIAARERIFLSRVVLAEKGQDVVGNHTVAIGVALAAIGAALACAFPQTETEDRLLGETRDRLVDDLRAALHTQVIRAA